MKIQANTTKTTARACERCGADRPAATGRFTIAFQDRTDGTIADERVFVCRNCWRRLRDLSREVKR